MGQLSHRSDDPDSYADAVARLASIGRELKFAEAFAGGPSSDADCWPDQVLGAATAGLEALAAVDMRVGPEASRDLVDRIRRELAEISGIVLKA